MCGQGCGAAILCSGASISHTSSYRIVSFPYIRYIGNLILYTFLLPRVPPKLVYSQVT